MDAWPTGPGVVEFPGCRRVRGRALRRSLPSGPPPTFGVYLGTTAPEEPPWGYAMIPWPDFRLPASRSDAVEILSNALERAGSDRVEVACGGGVGRTGTALAVMAILAGIAPADAVGWVRARYHPRAVEMPWQRRWVASLPPAPR